MTVNTIGPQALAAIKKIFPHVLTLTRYSNVVVVASKIPFTTINYQYAMAEFIEKTYELPAFRWMREAGNC
jgi:hypothetical protein